MTASVIADTPTRRRAESVVGAAVTDEVAQGRRADPRLTRLLNQRDATGDRRRDVASAVTILMEVLGRGCRS
jgi:hypothetical protein